MYKLPRGRIDIVIDSTGLVIHDEGHWTRPKYGKRKRRGWRNLYLESSNKFIVAKVFNEYQKTVGEIAPHLIKQVDKVDSITVDKTYGQSHVYEALNDACHQRLCSNQHSPKS